MTWRILQDRRRKGPRGGVAFRNFVAPPAAQGGGCGGAACGGAFPEDQRILIGVGLLQISGVLLLGVGLLATSALAAPCEAALYDRAFRGSWARRTPPDWKGGIV
jgi:hypothetical protein